MTHEWAGEGGVLDWHDELKGDDERQNMRAWIKPKTAHKAMIGSLLQRRIPIVFCFRAEEKVKVGPGGKPEPQGWTPIGDSRFMFELTTMITLSNEAPGIVSYKLPRKIQEQHLTFFPDGQPITEHAGEQLAAWARGEEPVDKAVAILDALIAGVHRQASDEAIAEYLSGEKEAKQVAALKERRPELFATLNEAIAAKRASFADKDVRDSLGGGA
jgi:hypothetical protein